MNFLNNNKIVKSIIAIFMILSLGLLVGCQNKPINNELLLKLTSSKAEIGIEGHQKWVFNKKNDEWLFDGVYAYIDQKYVRVFVGSDGRTDENEQLIKNGAYFSIQQNDNKKSFSNYVGNFVKRIEIGENEENVKSLKLSGKGFESVLTIEEGSKFVQRIFEFDIGEEVNINEGEISFALKTDIQTFNEYGFILGHANEVTQYSLPYAFPAMLSKLTSRENGEIVSLVNVVDYYNTNEAFKTVRRREHLNGFFELGIISSASKINPDLKKQLIEKIYISAETSSYYDLIYSARKTYSTFYDLPLESIHLTNGNMTVNNWIDAAIGAVIDITDSRSRPVGDDSTFGPYGYNNGSSEAFGAMDILKGLTRYAIAINDEELYNDCMNYLSVFITKNGAGHSYIMPLSNYKNTYSDEDVYFFRSQGSDGNFNPLDPSYTDTGDVFGSFKYYSRVLNIGELALITERSDLKKAYLSLMPFILKMRGPNYEQDIQWNFDGTPSNYEYDNGGSMGAAAMWANVMYVASLIETDATKSSEYLNHAINSLNQANKQDFPKSSALRHYPKPESLTYSTKMNLIVYEITGDEQYLNKALEVVQAVHFYYFASTHPNTYYQTLGYGYADARERWEAFMEMVETLVLGTNILKYTDDELLLDLYYTLEKSALWTLPINGYPEGYLGGHSDWLDALYVPFEQPTGHMGDNTIHDGGGMSYLRHSKELYGAGEIFTGALTFELFGKTSHEHISLINIGVAIDTKLDRENQVFAAWNISNENLKVPVFFDNFSEGIYSVYIDGMEIGTYNNLQLKNGITLEIKSRIKQIIEIKKTDKSLINLPFEQDFSVEIVETASNHTKIRVNGEASHFEIKTSYDNSFKDINTTKHISLNNQITLYHDDSSVIYVQITPVNEGGNKGKSLTIKIESGDVDIGYLEDFGYPNNNGVQPIPTWSGTSKYYSGLVSLISDSNGFKNYPDGFKEPMGYMAVYKPDYKGYDVDTFVHEVNLDISKYPLFDFYPYTKNIGSKFSLILEIGDDSYRLLDEIEHFNEFVYRFNLLDITNKLGDQKITVKMQVEGYNRGFAISQLRFVSETNPNNYMLSELDFYSDVAEIDQETGLSITHHDAENETESFTLGLVNLMEYETISLILSGVTIDHNRSAYINIEITKEGLNIPTISYRQLINYGQNISLSLEGFAIENIASMYNMKVFYTKRIGGEIISDINVKSVQLENGKVAKTINVYKQDDGDHILDGWSSNWAYISPEGYIYNGNPNVPYGSIYLKNVAVNLDETPLVRFMVSDVIPGTEFSLKVNDNNTFGVDLPLNTQTGQPGVYTINLRDKIGRGGVIVLQFDFYVIGEHQNNGAKFEYIEFVEANTIYENLSGINYSVVESNSFILNINQTPYMFVDISKITYGDSWKIFLEYEGIRYEVKTVYETVYGQMYSRTKYGAFKYDLSDILPENESGIYNLKLILELGGKDGAQIDFRAIKLSNNNEVPLIKKTTFIR